MVLDAVSAEATFEQIDDAAMLELAGLYLEQIVGEREEAKTGLAQLAQRPRNLWIRRHGRKPFGELLLVGVSDPDAAGIRQHLHDRGADVGEGNVATRDSERRGIHD